jgi:hypothetical protein
MFRKFLIGASALALASGTAQAANTWQNIQNGNQNSTTGSQATGTNEIAYIEQVGNNNTATNNQGPGANNYDFVAQRGNHNTATISQTGTANESDVFQGCGARQTGANAGTFRCGADFPFNNNTANVSQGGTNAFNYIFQIADGNSATVTQDGSSMGRPCAVGGNCIGAVESNTDIEQYTQNNIATVTQHNNSTINGSSNSYVQGAEGNVTIYQGVSYTDAPATPVTSANAVYADSTVDGSNNANVTQNAGATNSRVYVAQNLKANLALVTQGGSDEFVEIRQDNTAANAVLGNNTADVTQTGNSTVAFVFQNGISNSATLNQSTTAAFADIRQIGNQNHANISQ